MSECSSLPTIAIGVLTSLCATGIYALFLLKCRPSIKISPYIAKMKSEDGYIFLLKFRNTSKWFKVIDIDCEMHLSSINTGSGGTITKLKAIELKKSYFFEIPKYDKTDDGSKYAIQVGCTSDLSRDLSENDTHFLTLKIKARNGFSGFTSVFKERFNTPNIRVGEHGLGINDEVISIS